MMTRKRKKNHANSLTFRNEETFQVFFYLQEEIKHIYRDFLSFLFMNKNFNQKM